MSPIGSYLFNCCSFEFSGFVVADCINVSEGVESAHRINVQYNWIGADSGESFRP